MKQQIDCLGNRIQAIRCWNGHYEELIIEDIQEKPTEEKPKDIFPGDGFFSDK